MLYTYPISVESETAHGIRSELKMKSDAALYACKDRGEITGEDGKTYKMSGTYLNMLDLHDISSYDAHSILTGLLNGTVAIGFKNELPWVMDFSELPFVETDPITADITGDDVVRVTVTLAVRESDVRHVTGSDVTRVVITSDLPCALMKVIIEDVSLTNLADAGIWQFVKKVSECLATREPSELELADTAYSGNDALRKMFLDQKYTLWNGDECACRQCRPDLFDDDEEDDEDNDEEGF